MISVVSEQFQQLLINKIEGIRSDIIEHNPLSIISESTVDLISDTSVVTTLTEFLPISDQRIKYIILKSLIKSCELDPIPTWLLKSCFNELLRPLLKKTGLGTEKTIDLSLICPLYPMF